MNNSLNQSPRSHHDEASDPNLQNPETVQTPTENQAAESSVSPQPEKPGVGMDPPTCNVGTPPTIFAAIPVPMLQGEAQKSAALDPYLKIELRLTCCEDSQSIEVPLGYYLGGHWAPYQLVMDESELIDPFELIHKLIYDFMGTDSEFEDENEDKDEVADDLEEDMNEALLVTMKRCLALTKASAANGRTRSRRKRVV